MADRFDNVALDNTGCARREAIRPLVLIGMCLAVLIAQIDTSVVNLSTNAIGNAFRAGVAPLQWVLDAYNLVYAILLLSGGLVADLYGRRLAFMIGTIVMAAGSLICAGAPNVGILIAGRAITGMAASLLVPSSLAIIRVVWPEPAARGRALGIWSSCNGLAFAIGPTLGGAMIEAFGWRSVFLLAVPLASAALLLAKIAVPESANPQDRHLDVQGQVYGALALGGIALAAIAAHHGGWLPIAGLSVAAIALPLFLGAERRRGRTALVPLELFRVRAFSGGIVTTAAMTFGIYSMIFLLPLVWQSEDHLTPHDAGLALLSVSLTFFVVSTQSGGMAERLGARAMITIGTGLIGGGSLLIAATRAGVPMALAEIGLALAGVGMGLNTGPLYGVAVGSVGHERAGTASALINVARMAGATLGVALLGSVFALFHGGAAGFRMALALGGIVQLGGAVVAFVCCEASAKNNE